ncbi:hypothetical protein MMC16_007544 [Acarospora aff. strigata]|nr:hypothetical protein [Acarospora aff. strigata]
MNATAAQGAALQEWITSFPVADKVGSLTDLNDGQVLWKVLRDIDSDYFAGDLPEEGPSLSDHWLPRWQNMKHISKTLLNYILDECEQSLPPTIQTQDLKAIATDASASEITKVSNEATMHQAEAQNTIQLLKMTLIAAINSAKATDYIGKMPTLTTATQASLKSIIEKMQLAGDDVTDDTTPSLASLGPATMAQAMDPQLLFEERFGKVMIDNDNLMRDKRELEKQLRDLHNRLARLQENNDILQERLTEAEDRLELNGSAKGSKDLAEDSPVKLLEVKLQNQEDLIATQEGKLSDYQSSTEEMQKSIEKLRASSKKAQSLQDELDEIKLERDNLAKKANTIDKYKQKLQTAQNLEKDNMHLRTELDELHLRLKELETGQHKTAGLQLTIDEYKRILPKIEQDRVELQMMKKQLEFDNATLAHRWESANKQQARDQELIGDLTDKIREMESGQVLVPAPVSGGLEEELSKSTKTESDLQAAFILLKWNRMLTESRKIEVAKLSGEIQELKKSTPEEDAKSVMLQQLLDDANQKHAILEEKYLEAYQDKLVLESSLADVQQGHPIEGYGLWNPTTGINTHLSGSTEVFQKMRRQLSTYKRRLSESETELARTKAQLTTSQADRMSLQRIILASKAEGANELSVSLIGKDEREALEELKQFNSAELTDLRTDRSLLEKRAKGLEADLDEHNILLQKALLHKHEILTQQGDQRHDTEKLSNDLKATMDILKAANAGRAEGHADPDEMLEKHIKELLTAIKQGKERVAKLAEHTRKQNTVIRTLQDKVKLSAEEQKGGGLAPAETNRSTPDQKVGTSGTNPARRIWRAADIKKSQELHNLHRENKLMTTAWYDLTNRLQMNNVGLQRRSEVPPRSFLKKQRYQLNQISVRM